MARIASPPDVRDLSTESQARILRMQVEASGARDRILALADGPSRYLHWTKFRRQEPFPEGVTREEGWALVKMSRQATARELPFQAKDGHPVQVFLTEPLLAAVKRIEEHRSLQRAGLPQQPSPRELLGFRSFGQDALIDEAYYSAVIEGAITTRREARRMIREKLAPRDRSDWMILNNFQAGANLPRWAKEPMRPERLLEIQEILTANTLENEEDAGRFRSDDRVHIANPLTGEVVHVPPPAHELKSRMKALCDFANREDDEDSIPVLIQACLLHYQLAYDHPFGDGNGRTARWLFLWRLLRSPRYWWVALLSVSRMTSHHRQAYYDAFRFAAADEHDATYLVRLQVQSLEEEMDRFASFFAARSGLGIYLRRVLPLPVDLNPRQLALVAWLAEHPEESATQQGHADDHRVSQPTARKDLESMVALELLDRQEGRPVRYRPRSRLHSAIQAIPLHRPHKD